VPNEQLRARGEKLLERLHSFPAEIRLMETKTEVGGGALPRSRMKSIALEISAPRFSPNELAARLRRHSPPVIGYVASNRFKLDLRTIFPEEDEIVAAALRQCLTTPTR
jgi:L-seryl-tRNA(Ser) seleniumtransferase